MEPYDLREKARRWRELASVADARTASALRQAADMLDARSEETEKRLAGPRP